MNQKQPTIEEIASQRAEELADLQAIPEFMRKKPATPNPTKSKKSTMAPTAVIAKDSMTKNNLFPSISRNSKASSHSASESLITVDTSPHHTKHHAHMYTTTVNATVAKGKDARKLGMLNSASIIADDKSIGQFSNDSYNTTGTTAWAAIDTLDDVRKLAQNTPDVDYFHEDAEKYLNTMRYNHIKLLKLMKERNSRLEKVEPTEDTNNYMRLNTSKADLGDDITKFSLPGTPAIDNNDVKKDIKAGSPVTIDKKKQSANLPGTTVPATQVTSLLKADSNEHIENKPIYVSDYLENLDNVEEITAKECEYIEKMEQIIKDANNV